MQDVNRLTVEEFFDWQNLVDGRYELVDGHIIPHPDFFSPQGFAAPDNDHAAVCANLVFILQSRLQPPCRVYAGAGAVVDRNDANVPDVAVSCDEADRHRKAIESPRFVFEVSSPRTHRIDTGRKVSDYLSIPGVAGYVVVSRETRSIAVYRPGASPETFADGKIVLSDDLAFDLGEVFA